MQMIVQAPPPELASHVVALWTLTGRAAGLYAGLPKPYPELILSLSGRHTWQASRNSTARSFHLGWLTPIQTGPRFAMTDGDLHLVGARLRLTACVQLFGLDSVRPPWLPIPLDHLIGGAATLLRERLLAQQEPANQMRILAQWLEARLQDPAPVWLPSQLRLERLGWRVDALADALQLSPRGLHKRFVERIGIGPKLWLQVSRFDALLRHSPSRSELADIAQRFGFADQSHMNAEFRRFAGASPLAYVSRRNAHLAPDTAPHFLPGAF